MVDVERQVFDICARAAMAVDQDVFVSSENVSAPADFPCVSIVESDSMTAQRLIDSSSEEKFTDVSYEVVVYSNLRSGAKTQAKELAKAVDDAMVPLNFRRTYSGRVSSPASSPTYRITSRYVATVGSDGKIYRR